MLGFARQNTGKRNIGVGKLYAILVLALLLLSLLPLALAARTGPVATCPDGYQLQTVTQGDGSTSQAGRNDDGWFCTKPMPTDTILLVRMDAELPHLVSGFTVVIIVGT
jgi:hypothetical protein